MGRKPVKDKSERQRKQENQSSTKPEKKHHKKKSVSIKKSSSIKEEEEPKKKKHHKKKPIQDTLKHSIDKKSVENEPKGSVEKELKGSVENELTNSVENELKSSVEKEPKGSIENELTSSIKKGKKSRREKKENSTPTEEEDVDLFPKALLNKRFSNYHVFVFQGMTKNGNPSHKYWAIKLQGFALITVYGSMGKMNMRSTTREFPSNAQQELVRKINEKQKKGYRYVVNTVSLHSKGSDKNDDSFDNL
jgi:predicted DNA-binding WGR domain protein